MFKVTSLRQSFAASHPGYGCFGEFVVAAHILDIARFNKALLMVRRHFPLRPSLRDRRDSSSAVVMSSIDLTIPQICAWNRFFSSPDGCHVLHTSRPPAPQNKSGRVFRPGRFKL